MRKVIDFLSYKKKKQTPLDVVRAVILNSNNLKTVECLCRISKDHAKTGDMYHINASVHCIESIRQEIDDLLERIKETQGNLGLTFDQ